MRLAHAEAKRLLARRFTWIMLLVVTAISAVIVVGFGIDSQPRSPEVIAAAEQQAAEQREVYARERERCERDLADGSAEYPEGFNCAQAFDESQIQLDWFLPNIYSFAQNTGEIVAVAGFLLALFGFAVAASFIGAEWSSGSLANLLLWRPRRLPVLATKLAVVVAGIVVAGTLLLAVLIGALYVVASVRGDVSGTTADTWRILGLQTARSLTLAVAAGGIGFALASIGRSTAMALGSSIGYVVVVEVGLQIVLTLAEATFPQRYLLSTYAFGWLQGGTTLQSYARCDSEQYTTGPVDACQPDVLTITLTDTAVVGGVVLAVFLGLAAVLFVRRDVS